MFKIIYTLKLLDYWFDTDQEILDAMSVDERADHIRLHMIIKDALSDFCPSCHEPKSSPSGDGCAAMTIHKGET